MPTSSLLDVLDAIRVYFALDSDKLMGCCIGISEKEGCNIESR
jgi:hypothetical protein